MTSQARSFWNEKKDLAIKLYKAGQEVKLKEGLLEVQKKYKEYDQKDPEILANMKRDVALVKANCTKPFPIKFDRDLGPLLDKLETVFKKKAKSESEQKAIEKERKELADKILVIRAHYSNDVKQASDALSFASHRAEQTLQEALMKLDGITRTMSKNDSSDLKHAVQALDHAPTWKSAKTKSENAYKKLIKDKEALALLKSQKINGFPFEFKDDFGDLLTRVHKDAKEFKASLADSSEKAYKIGLRYASEIEVTKKRLEKLLTGFHPDIRDMTEPLEKAIDVINADLKKLSVRV
jgi:hypothetical protein